MTRWFQHAGGVTAALVVAACAHGDAGKRIDATAPESRSGRIALGSVAQAFKDPPQTRSPVTLSAVSDTSGRVAFAFEGQQEPPVIRVSPGESIRVTYRNAMLPSSPAMCATAPCMNMTNLHFHGLHVSPNAPQDDVLTMIAMPGQSLEYTVHVPPDAPSGLYWYHPHPHGESYKQVLDGMSGAIVIEGIERYVPEVQAMRERILVLRDAVIAAETSDAMHLKQAVEMPASRCGASTGQPERIFTVNGAIRPEIPIAAGERQFWRIVNASPDLYADLQVDGEEVEIVALDGMPLGYHHPEQRTRRATHLLLPPAGRLEAIVTGRAGAKLRTLCFDTGSDGDPNPAMVLADLVDAKQEPTAQSSRAYGGAAVSRVVPSAELARIEASSPDFTAVFTEHDHAFYINDLLYSPDGDAMTRVRVGAYHHWRVVNSTQEAHPFHIHQVHFLVYATNDEPAREPEWRDTVDVPPGGSVDVVMDFTDPIIRGMSVFHCHLLNHEDKGMMAKILFY